MRATIFNWAVFVIHSLLFVGMIGMSYLIVAPIFGVQPDMPRIVKASLFGLLAFFVLSLNIISLWKKDLKLTIVLIVSTWSWIMLWCVFVSGYDMIYVLIPYSVCALFLVYLLRRSRV